MKDAFTITSWTAMLAAFHMGLVVTAILAAVPAILSQAGVSDADIGVVIASLFIGQLVLQTPLDLIADRMDLRFLLAIVAALTWVVAALAWFLIITDVAHRAGGGSAQPPRRGRGARRSHLARLHGGGGARPRAPRTTARARGFRAPGAEVRATSVALTEALAEIQTDAQTGIEAAEQDDAGSRDPS